MATTPHTDAAAALADAEKRFYNSRTRTFDTLRRLIWRSIGAFQRSNELARFYDANGKAVLEYGCGSTAGTRKLLQAGASHVTGVDISEREIERAQAWAEREGIADRSDFVVADAHRLPFPDDAFELVVGRSILHHLDLEVALRELRRVLKHGGVAVFSEPLAQNPILRLGRRLTPSARTPDEHPLTVEDWKLCGSIFDGFTHHEVEFLSIPLMPVNLLLPRRAQEALAVRVSRADDRLLAAYPGLRRHARITFLVLS